MNARNRPGLVREPSTTELGVGSCSLHQLRFVDDMDLLEIAEVTGMKEGTVKAHLFHALQAVRERVGESK